MSDERKLRWNERSVMATNIAIITHDNQSDLYRQRVIIDDQTSYLVTVERMTEEEIKKWES